MNNNEELQLVSIPEESQVSSEQEVYYLTYKYKNILSILNGCFGAIKVLLGCGIIIAFIMYFTEHIERYSFQFDTEYKTSFLTILTLGLDALGGRDPISVAQATSTLGTFGVISFLAFIMYYISQFLANRRDMISGSILLVLSIIIGVLTIYGFIGTIFVLIAIGIEIYALVKIPRLNETKSQLIQLGVVVEEPYNKFNYKAWIVPTLIFIVVTILTILALSVDISKFAPGYNINQIADVVVDKIGGRTNTTTKYQFQLHNYYFNMKICWTIVSALSTLVFFGFNNLTNKVYSLIFKIIGLIFSCVTIGLVTYLIIYAFKGQGIVIGVILIVVDLLIVTAIILTIIDMVKIVKSGNMKELITETFVG